MRLSIRNVFAPVLAVLMLVLVLNVTLSALGASGAWRRVRTRPSAMRENLYAPLDRLLAERAAGVALDPVRNPFAFRSEPVASTTNGTVPRVRRPVPPPPPPAPQLTSIVWDADPRATIRWGGRDWSVRPNTLFDEFRVVSIARDQVVLERGAESLVLRLPNK